MESESALMIYLFVSNTESSQKTKKSAWEINYEKTEKLRTFLHNSEKSANTGYATLRF